MLFSPILKIITNIFYVLSAIKLQCIGSNELGFQAFSIGKAL